MIALSPRSAALGYSPSMAVADEARRLRREGRPIIDLSLGELDFPTPQNICEAAIRALRDGHTRYDSAAGLLALRQAICRKLERENGLVYSSEQISVGCGAKQVIFNALATTLHGDDEVVIPIPYWTSYPDMVRLAGGKPVFANSTQAQGFKLRPDALAAALNSNTKWLILNSPNNPSGAVYSPDELRQLATVLEDFPAVGVISDDIYEHMLYKPNVFATIASAAPSLKHRTLTVNGMSKTYAMTGWRVGYGAGPKELIKAIGAFQSQTTTHTSTISQHAAIEALDGPQDTRDEYARAMTLRARITADLVRRTPGLRCLPPAGAFYCFIDCSQLIGLRSAAKTLETDIDVARFLLEAADVAVVPGSAYGMSRYFRVSFAADREALETAFTRIAAAIGRLV
jgi:aspartate aminotransferase